MQRITLDTKEFVLVPAPEWDKVASLFGSTPTSKKSTKRSHRSIVRGVCALEGCENGLRRASHRYCSRACSNRANAKKAKEKKATLKKKEARQLQLPV